MSARELITEHLDFWTGAVTKKSGSGRGSNGKTELTGVKKLRELILELAVRGKLVDQNSNDERASVLLEKISQEKATLAKQGKIKIPKKLPAITEEDVPFELPNGWQWARIWEISELITSGSRDWAKYYSESGATFITMGNLSRDDYKLRLDNLRYVSPPAGSEGARTSLQGGDLVVSITGDVGNLGLIPEGFGEAYINQHSCLVRISSLCRNRYHAEFLRSPCAKSQFEEPQRGVKNSFRLSDMGEMLIPVPPLEEQHRIVQKVDELMALCDRLEQQTNDQLEAHETLVDTLLGNLTQSETATELADNWARLAAHFDTLFTTEQSIDKLKQTVLQLAVMGRLVEQDAGDEPAQELIAKLSAAKTELIREGMLKKSRKLPDISNEEALTPLPSGWVLTRLGDAYDVRDGTHDSPKYQSSGYPLITSKNLSSGELSFEDVKLISESDHQKIQERSEVRKGDILFAMIGSIGNPVVVNTDKEFSIKNVALFKYYSNNLSSPSFLKLFLEHAAENLKQQAAGGVQSFVSLGKLRSWLIPLPPLAEQNRIVQKVDELMALCDKLKERLNQASETQIELAKTLTKNALALSSRKENHTAEAKSDSEILARELLEKLNLNDYVIKVPVSKGRSSKSGAAPSRFIHLEVRGPQGEGGVEYLDLPPLLRKIDELASSHLGDEMLTGGISELLGLAGNVFTHGAGTVLKTSVVALKRLFGQLKRLDQIYALILMTFPQRDERSDAEINERLKNACKLTGLPSIDEYELSSRLNHLKSLGFVKRHKSMEDTWLLVHRYRRTDYF